MEKIKKTCLLTNRADFIDSHAMRLFGNNLSFMKILFVLIIAGTALISCNFPARKKVATTAVKVSEKNLPKVVSGQLVRLEKFPSRYVTNRNIDIWLPDGYAEREKYAVLYMNDGQMLYDATQTWNKQAWCADSVATNLMRSNGIRKFIIVGVWNDKELRHSDYFPQKPFEKLTQTGKDTVNIQLKRAGVSNGDFRPNSDAYLKFLIEELKPYIDNHFSVKIDTGNTYILGSSMGGLISMYALCEYPEVFGGAACMSTHWPGTFTLKNNPVPNAFLAYLSENLPNPSTHKLYFDCGDATLDALYPNIQKKVDSITLAKGYDETNFLSRFFPDENHSENAWQKRLDIPLYFLFGK